MRAELLSAAALLAFTGGSFAAAATLPAGTVFVVRTLSAISSVDAPGTSCAAQLEQPITVNGKSLLPAGTKFAGKVVTSRRLASKPEKLTVNLTAVELGGRKVSITTTGAQLLSNDIRTARGVSVSRANYTVAAGK